MRCKSPAIGHRSRLPEMTNRSPMEKGNIFRPKIHDSRRMDLFIFYLSTRIKWMENSFVSAVDLCRRITVIFYEIEYFVQLTIFFHFCFILCYCFLDQPTIGQLPIPKRRNLFRGTPNLVRRWRYSQILPRSSTRPCAGTHEPIRRHSSQHWCFDLARQY